MFGFIKKLFGGIFAFLGGLFGGKKAQGDASTTPEIAPKAKKSNAYYLELDATGNTKSEVKALKPESAKAAVAVEAKPEPVMAAVATAGSPAKVDAPATAKKLKAGKAKAPAAEAENGKVKIEAQPNPPAETNGKASDEVTFAPNYLMPTTTGSRRRPGPNMSTFLDMARQAKTPG